MHVARLFKTIFFLRCHTAGCRVVFAFDAVGRFPRGAGRVGVCCDVAKVGCRVARILQVSHGPARACRCAPDPVKDLAAKRNPRPGEGGRKLPLAFTHATSVDPLPRPSSLAWWHHNRAPLLLSPPPPRPTRTLFCKFLRCVAGHQQHAVLSNPRRLG